MNEIDCYCLLKTSTCVSMYLFYLKEKKNNKNKSKNGKYDKPFFASLYSDFVINFLRSPYTYE